MKIYIWVLVFTGLSTINCALNPSKVVVAINCGANRELNIEGVKYIPDEGIASGGTKSDFGTQYSEEWKSVGDLQVYKTERYAMEDLSYQLPLDGDGLYTLILKFSEVFFSSSNEKLFNIALGDYTVIEDFDIYEKAGKFTPYDEFIQFEVKNNQIYYKNKVIKSAIDYETKKLILSFNKGSRDNPKINGIVLVKGDLEDTNYKEMKEFVEDVKRKAILEKESQRKKRLESVVDKEAINWKEFMNYNSYDFTLVKKDEESLLASFLNCSYLFELSIAIFLIFFLFVLSKSNIEAKKERKVSKDQKEKPLPESDKLKKE